VSTIVWVLLMTVSGWHGWPVSVSVSFATEAECERAALTVASGRQNSVTKECKPLAVKR